MLWPKKAKCEKPVAFGLLLLSACGLCLACESAAQRAFLLKIEDLILHTLDSALLITRSVYQRLGSELATTHADSLWPAVQPLLDTYLGQVQATLAAAAAANYTLKRRLLRQFKANNWHIERLNQQLAPLQRRRLQFQLLSDGFLQRRHNRTDFDNLYLSFMTNFERHAAEFCASVSQHEPSADEQELRDILAEIHREADLRERDKLYDEFIEIYLFKNEQMHFEF